jgi:hypothetical protein
VVRRRLVIDKTITDSLATVAVGRLCTWPLHRPSIAPLVVTPHGRTATTCRQLMPSTWPLPNISAPTSSPMITGSPTARLSPARSAFFGSRPECDYRIRRLEQSGHACSRCTSARRLFVTCGEPAAVGGNPGGARLGHRVVVVGVQVFPQLSDVVFKLSTTPAFK